MTFRESVRTCLREKYFTFSGRAVRSEYWWFYLFSLLFMLALAALGIALALAMGALRKGFDLGSSGGAEIAGMVALGLAMLGGFLYILIPGITCMVRRFHDVGIPGWVYALLIVAGFIPFGGGVASIAVLVIAVIRGTRGPNRYGPDPLEFRTAADVFA